MSKKIDYEEITKLVDFLEEKKLTHFELEVEGFKIRISRPGPDAPAFAKSEVSASQPHDRPEPISSSSTSQIESSNNFHYVTSPMVGTFYRAPDPTSPPFVDIDDEVKTSQTLCIIEAMKLMNEIESDTDGIIKEIFVENGKPVEYGQKLFAIQLVSPT
jgi:acetyl-CoA carboxylase biotin carboxyl carrier protein